MGAPPEPKGVPYFNALTVGEPSDDDDDDESLPIFRRSFFGVFGLWGPLSGPGDPQKRIGDERLPLEKTSVMPPTDV